MGLRDELVKYFRGQRLSDWHADYILFLPSGMEKVSICSHCTEGYIGSEWEHITCPVCNGSSEIVTDLTLEEAIEHLKLCVEIQEENIGSYKLPSGERISVKK